MWGIEDDRLQSGDNTVLEKKRMDRGQGKKDRDERKMDEDEQRRIVRSIRKIEIRIEEQRGVGER